MFSPLPPAAAAFPWNIAVPSCVIPAHIPENAAFLTGKVREVGLCFFESASCLAYGPDVLPAALAELPLQWHVHLPLDLPWQDGGLRAAETACRLLEKIAYLSPCGAVLHPPVFSAPVLSPARPTRQQEAPEPKAVLRETDQTAPQETRHAARQQEALTCFARLWHQHTAVPLLLENTPACDVTALLPVLEAEDCGVCLDMGHYLGYGQRALAAAPALLARVALVHWSAPGTGDQHCPLTALTPAQQSAARALAQHLLPQARHMLEIFSWQGIEASLPVLEACLNRPA